MSRLLPGLALALAAATTACTESTLTLFPATMHLDALGEARAIQVVYNGLDFSGPSAPPPVFETSDDRVAIVSDSGVVTSVGNGEATITLRAVDRVASVRVTVAQEPFLLEAGPVLPNSPATALFTGQVLQGFAVAYDRNGFIVPTPSATWSSASPTVLDVSTTGTITARARGQGVVLVRLGNLAQQLTYNVQ